MSYTGRCSRFTAAAFISMTLSGCVLAPKEAKDEKQRLRVAGQTYQTPFEKRQLPELPPTPTAFDVLRRALLANGELESAYFDWAVAVARIKEAGAYPNSPVSIGFAQSFDGGRIKSFDQTSITAGPDSMENLEFPTKVAKKGEVAFAMARAAGRRFVAIKLDVQKRVLQAWFDYTLTGESIRIQRQDVALQELVNSTIAGGLQDGDAQTDLLRAKVNLRLAKNQLASLEAERVQQRSRLNAMLSRPADTPLEPPGVLPDPRVIPGDDATLLIAAARNDPALQSLAYQIAGRQDALDLARMQYIPDFNPSFGLTGASMQLIGLGITLPTVLPRIEGMIEEARANLRAGEATYRQTRQDRAASLVAALASMRNSERQAAVFANDIIPLSERVVDNTRRSYVAGSATYLDLINAQKTLLDSRLALAEARVAREKTLAEIESLAGFDVETLAALSSPSTQPTHSVSEVQHD